MPYCAYVFEIGTHISSKSSDWASFGSYYGGVAGVLINFLALMAVIFNLVRQDNQIRSISVQQKITHVETTVGGLLDALGNIIDGMEYKFSGDIRQGRIVFRFLYRRLKQQFIKAKDEGVDIDSAETIEDVYIEFYRSWGNYIGNYFRTMYNVVKYIDNSDLPILNKREMISWLTCRLSRYELIMLFYNCASSLGSSKFKPYIEKYHLLEHLESERLASFAHLNIYDESAYGNE